MSLEKAKSFLNKAEEDDALREKLEDLEGDSAAAVKLGAEHGFEFTAEEFNAAMDEMYYGDLSDDELEDAAGGQTGYRPPLGFD
jgi:predicted ribosomally synthesized peptide with nif11-like leader